MNQQQTKPCVQTETVLCKLSRAYLARERAAVECKAHGGKFIGCLGSDVPEELIIAAGFHPLRISGDPKETVEMADRYLELAFDPVARSQFNRVINGTYSFLDHLVISNSTDVYVRLYYYLREIRRVEPQITIPDFYFFDFLFMYTRTSNLYNQDRVNDFKRLLEKWSGRLISEDSIKRAIAICNENRRLLRKFSELRGPEAPHVSGVQALQVIGSSMFMPREEHNRLLRRLLEEAKEWPALPGIRLYVTGSVHEQTDFYELVESCGAVIVGEDHDWGNRHYHGEVDTTVDPIAAIVDRYQLRQPSLKKTLPSQRVTSLLEQVQASGAEGVIFFFREWDESASWDFPEQYKALQSMGIPVLLLVRQPYKLSNTDDLRSQVSGFIDLVHSQKGGK